MFEALVTLCLAAQPEVCKAVLLPGYEAVREADCVAALNRDPVDLSARFPDLVASGAAQCARVGAALDVTEVAPGIFVHVGAIAEPTVENMGDVANTAFIVGTESVAVIDTGSTRHIGEMLWRAIRAHTDLPVSHVILTHMHPDHAFGAGPFVETGAMVVGHASLDRALADRRANYRESLATLVGADAYLGSDSVATDLTAAPTLSLDLGGRTLQLQAWPAAHTGTDVTVFDISSATLFAGDLVFDDHAPALDGSLRGWQQVLQDLKAIPAERVVPGHGQAVLPWPEGARPMERYLEVLARDTRAAIDSGMRLGEAVEQVAGEEAAHWSLFEAYNPRNATVAFTELEWE